MPQECVRPRYTQSMHPTHSGRAFALLLLVIVAIWAGIWLLTAQSGTVGPSPDSGLAAPAAPLLIRHTRDGELDVYSGAVELPPCSQLAAGITSSGTAPARIELRLSSVAQQPCEIAVAHSEEFTLSHELSSSTRSATLDAVQVNGAPISFTLTDL